MTRWARGARAQTRAVEGFWHWWETGGRSLAAASASRGGSAELVREMTRRVRAIHRGLAWEFGPGAGAADRLTLTGEGDAAARVAAQRWVTACPEETDWEFASSRGADARHLEATLEVGDTRIRLDDVAFRVRADEERRRVDVTVLHPSFDSIPPFDAAQIGFLALDWLLGEDEVTRWVGEVDTAAGYGSARASREELTAAVEALHLARDEDGWMLATVTTEAGNRYVAMVRSGYRWLDRPELDLGTEISIRFAVADGDIPREVLQPLDDFEEQVESALGSKGLVLVHTTRPPYRSIHVYTDSREPDALRLVRDLVRAMPGARMRTALDPGWNRVREYLG